jgi:hypothetical protein
VLQKILQTEPARFISLIVAAVGLAVSFGLLQQPRADAWVAIATAAVPFLLPLIQGILTRQTVFAPATVQVLADAATNLPAGSSVDIGKPPDGGVAVAQG